MTTELKVKCTWLENILGASSLDDMPVIASETLRATVGPQKQVLTLYLKNGYKLRLSVNRFDFNEAVDLIKPIFQMVGGEQGQWIKVQSA